jgi:hypothetical protein
VLRSVSLHVCLSVCLSVCLTPTYRNSSTYAISGLHTFIKVKNEKVTFLDGPPNVSLREKKRNERKMAVEYCWAITQAMSQSCCGQLLSSVFVV